MHFLILILSTTDGCPVEAKFKRGTISHTDDHYVSSGPCYTPQLTGLELTEGPGVQVLWGL